MTNGVAADQTVADPYIASLKEARHRPAVLKIKLASLRSEKSDCIIFAFEGDEDKSVYAQWVRRIRPDLSYEPFPCEGKTRVLELRDMLDRDRTGLNRDVYFFIDRDFDDLRGREADLKTFMTDCYSVENYLARRDVLDELLKDEFHCHAEPAVRARTLSLFDSDLAQFCSVTREINFRIYIARILQIRIVVGPPTKIRNLATVAIGQIEAVEKPANEIVGLEREPTADEIAEWRPKFDALDRACRYRGKFNLAFFYRWLELLATDRAADAPAVFPQSLGARTVNRSGLSIGMLASKSSLPNGLPIFIGSI